MANSAPGASALDGYSICPDVSFRVQGQGVLASNYRARRHVWLSLALFNSLAGGPADGELRAADLTRFSNLDGLYADPTCLDRTGEFQPSTFAVLDEALEYLSQRFVVIRDGAAYDAFFAPKNSILDRQHFGTFHQQLGMELVLRLRKDPAVWWYEQKFDRATGQVKDNLYKFVQEAFLKRYVGSLDLKGRTVLDFGCGNGFAARRFVEHGAVVIGVDPDENLLAEAARTVGDSFQPVLMRPSDPDPLAVLPNKPFDLIWLSDVLLYYFYPQDGGQAWTSPGRLLHRLSTQLRPDGRCVIIQPHGVFWLAPWLGDPHRPYTIISEYASRLYSVTPSLEEVSNAIREAGLAITGIFEPKPEPAGRAFDATACSFASSFPQWWVFECARLSGSGRS